MNAAEIDALCEAAFAAYNQRAGGKTWDGKPIPPWGEMLAIDHDGPMPEFEAT